MIAINIAINLKIFPLPPNISDVKVNEITDAFVEFDIDNDGTITTKVR